ncbi:hypothetical protein QAD02_015758 [Eretmocerus hayati]|uniref:Uncharacterized protein n=1 Tax=Eretmocerus hayati TaxID=131215 RepID=A0ACC2P951_9HYME|nr:hypothetical protein QAD02_015758 [Eretmocerus hayati]
MRGSQNVSTTERMSLAVPIKDPNSDIGIPMQQQRKSHRAPSIAPSTKLRVSDSRALVTRPSTVTRGRPSTDATRKPSSIESRYPRQSHHHSKTMRDQVTAALQGHSKGGTTGGNLLARRDRLRVFDAGEDVTPRSLVHPHFGHVEERRTAFDALGRLASGSRNASFSAIGGGAGMGSRSQRPSLITLSSSFGSQLSIDDVLQAAAGRADSLASGSVHALLLHPKPAPHEDGDAPSQYHLPRMASREVFSPDARVTITLRETETLFLFELPQLTAAADTEEGRLVMEENERYTAMMGGAGRKSVDAEAQTPQLYTKTRSTLVERHECNNAATFVNNWVMYDDLNQMSQFDDGMPKSSGLGAGEPMQQRLDEKRNRLILPQRQKQQQGLASRGTNTSNERHLMLEDGSTGNEEDEVAALGRKQGYEDASRMALRVLASKRFEEAHKRFAGLLKEDPRDPDLTLTYSLELLWRHAIPATRDRPVSCFRWNPVNASLIAVGYTAPNADSASNSNDEGPAPAQGLVLIWCAKNPSEPDRLFEFNSPVSDLDWSSSKPNYLGIGFYDGMVRIVDVSKKKLSIVRQSERKTSPSYEPHWQVQWWPVETDSLDARYLPEYLYTSNQDGRVCYYPAIEEFPSREIMRVMRVEGKIPGVTRSNQCPSSEVPLSRSPGVLLLRRHPSQPGLYLLGTDEGCVLRCSTSQPHGHLGSFLAHDGPIYSLEFSPFCDKVLLSCGADWCSRVWADGLDEPLLVFGTSMTCVAAAAWSPVNSTIFASAVGNEICIWDLSRKTRRPASVLRLTTQSTNSSKTSTLASTPSSSRFTKLEFSRGGEQLVAADDSGNVYVYALSGMPLPPLDQRGSLMRALRNSLGTRPEIIDRLIKLGPPFNELEINADALSAG